jgi:hypothetical protein
MQRHKVGVDEDDVERDDNLEDDLDDAGRNPTQRRLDAEGVDDTPVDLTDGDTG